MAKKKVGLGVVYSRSYRATPVKIIGTRKKALPKWKIIESYTALRSQYPEQERFIADMLEKSMSATTLKKQNRIWRNTLYKLHKVI